MTFRICSPILLLWGVVLILTHAVAVPASAQIGTSSDDAGSTVSDPRVKESLDEDGWNYEVDKDGDYKMILNFSSEERTHLLYVRSSTSTTKDMEIREVWAPVYKANGEIPAEVARWALQKSWKLKVGSLASDENGTIYLVSKIDADADADILSKIIRITATSADDLEEEQTGSLDDL